LVTFLGCHHASFLDVKALSENMDKAEVSTTERSLNLQGVDLPGVAFYENHGQSLRVCRAYLQSMM